MLSKFTALPKLLAALAPALVLGGALSGIAAPARAAPGAAALPLASMAAESRAELLHEARWVQRCRPVFSERVRPNGRVVRVRRDVCRRVWVGPPRRGYRY